MIIDSLVFLIFFNYLKTHSTKNKMTMRKAVDLLSNHETKVFVFPDSLIKIIGQYDGGSYECVSVDDEETVSFSNDVDFLARNETVKLSFKWPYRPILLK